MIMIHQFVVIRDALCIVGLEYSCPLNNDIQIKYLLFITHHEEIL